MSDSDTQEDRILEIVGLCGCGSGDDARLLLDLLFLLYEQYQTGEQVQGEGCYESPAKELAAKVLDRADLITHGGGIGFPWLTVEGVKVVRELKKLPRGDE